MSAQVRSQVGCSAPHGIDHPELPRDAGKAPECCSRRIANTTPNTPLPNRPDAATAASIREDIMGKLRSGGGGLPTLMDVRRGLGAACTQSLPAPGPLPIRPTYCRGAHHRHWNPVKDRRVGWGSPPDQTRKRNATGPAETRNELELERTNCKE